MKKNAFITFCCACVPGCGQMYQGYMKRGLSLLFWFASVCFFASVARLYGILFLLPVIWAYAFFDTFNLRNLSAAQRATFMDAFIPDPTWMNQTGLDKWRNNLRFSKIAGWVLVILGAVVLLTNFRDIVVDLLYSINSSLAHWLVYSSGFVFSLAVGAAIILLGMRMLRGPRQSEAPPTADSFDEDVPPPVFTAAPEPDQHWQDLGQPPAGPEPMAPAAPQPPAAELVVDDVIVLQTTPEAEPIAAPPAEDAAASADAPANQAEIDPSKAEKGSGTDD